MLNFYILKELYIFSWSYIFLQPSPHSLYDFAASQFKKEGGVMITLMNFPALEGFKSFLVLTIYTQTQHIKLFV